MLVKKNKLILMNQTHSNKVIEIKKNNYKKKINSDAMITKLKVCLGVVTADCVPIIIYDLKMKYRLYSCRMERCFSGIIKNTVNKIKKLILK